MPRAVARAVVGVGVVVEHHGGLAVALPELIEHAAETVEGRQGVVAVGVVAQANGRGGVVFFDDPPRAEVFVCGVGVRAVGDGCQAGHDVVDTLHLPVAVMKSVQLAHSTRYMRLSPLSPPLSPLARSRFLPLAARSDPAVNH